MTTKKACQKRAGETASELWKPPKKQAKLESTSQKFGHVATEEKPEGIRAQRPEEASDRPKSVSRKTNGESDAEDDYIVCNECVLVENQDLLLVCTGRQCTTILHLYCILPELYEMPEGKWFCRVCRDSKGPRNGGNARGGLKGANVMKDRSKGTIQICEREEAGCRSRALRYKMVQVGRVQWQASDRELSL
jgi:hypothetical protein